MSQADDLLATLSVDYTDEARIYVNDDRTITVPDELKHIAVQGDHNIETVTFDCPRYWDGHDFSKMRVYVTYMRADGFKDSYQTKNLRISEEDDTRILFDWTISGNVTKVSGTLSFLVYIESISANPCWHSRLNQQMVIDEGLSATEQILRAPDSIEAVLAQTTADYIATAKAEIEGKTAQSLASIPEDYTTVNNMAEEALREKSNAVKMEAEGEVITVSNSADNALLGLKIYGKSTQVTTTGAQLFNTGDIISNIYVTVDEDDILYIDCDNTGNDATKYAAFYTPPSTLIKPATTYAIVLEVFSASGLGENVYLTSHYSDELSQFEDTASVTSLTVGTHVELAKTYTTFDSPKYACRSFMSIPPNVHVKAAIRLSVLADTSVSADAFVYEHYSGGFASPSIDWPQPIVNLENVEIDTCGSNLFDVDSMALTTNTSLEVSSDKYTITTAGGTANIYAHSGYKIPTSLLAKLKGRTIYLEADSITTTNENSVRSCVQLNMIRSDGKAEYASVRPGRLAVSATIPENTTSLEINLYTNNHSVKLDSDVTVVVKGLRLTVDGHGAWSTYKPLRSVTAIGPICGIPVPSGGNYTDPDGQHWICDEVDFERGVYVKRIGVTNFADATWAQNSSGKYFSNKDRDLYAEGYPILCTHVVGGTSSSGNVENVMFINANQDIRLNLTLSDPSVVNVAAVMADATMIGVLATPIETPLSDAELASFKMVRSHYPNTTVLNDSGAHMAIKYTADTKTYVDNSLSNGTLVDTATGKLYRLAVTNGQLTVVAV